MPKSDLMLMWLAVAAGVLVFAVVFILSGILG
jgi:hypothetical protein